VRLRDFLAPERAIVPLNASTLREATAQLLERLLPARGVLDAVKLRRRINEARSDDIVAMGDRAFLLHYRTDAVGQLVVALGVSPEPVCVELGDQGGRCARVFLLIATPPRHAARYLQVVGAFARLLRQPEVLAAIHAAPDPAALVDLNFFAEYRLPEQLTVRDVMTDHPLTVNADLTLREAARMLARTGLGALPVVDDEDRVLGMVSEKEVIRHLLTIQAFTGPDARAASPPGTLTKTVRDAMTRQVLCVAAEQPLAEVAALMSNKDVDRVPVVRDDRLVGFLTRGDIVRKLIGS
jgi:CBS domain-containing protein/mannitol/fructose-specific phosphotransferase system IIA component (Ntr-type)